MEMTTFLKFFRFLKNEKLWLVFIPLCGLILTLSPRPSIVISATNENSSRTYISTEIKNTGRASAFDFEYDLVPVLKTTEGTITVDSSKRHAFGKPNILPNQIYQAGWQIPRIDKPKMLELWVDYEISYRYSLTNIPGLDRYKRKNKVTGLFYWNGKKWDTR